MLPHFKEVIIVIERNYYLQKLIKSKGNGKIKILNGLSGSGKSFLLNETYTRYLTEQGIENSQIIYVDLDNFSFNNAEEVNNFISKKMTKGKHYYIFIDEFFNIPDYLMLILEYANNNLYDVYATVSDLDCSTLSSKSLFEMIHIYPLSFSEYVSYKNDIDSSHLLEEYISYGGLLGLQSCETDTAKLKYLKYICYEKILPRIMNNHNIYNEQAFLNLTKTLAYEFGHVTTPYKCGEVIKDVTKQNVSNKTLSIYLDFLSASNLIYKSKRYLLKEEKYSISAARYYFEDVGILNCYADFKPIDRFLRLQNMIFIELKRRGFEVCSGLYSHLKKENKRPVRYNYIVPFLATKGSMKYSIELARDSQIQAEGRAEALANIKDSSKKIVLVDDKIKTYINDNKVVIMSLTDFFLNENSLDT